MHLDYCLICGREIKDGAILVEHAQKFETKECYPDRIYFTFCRSCSDDPTTIDIEEISRGLPIEMKESLKKFKAGEMKKIIDKDGRISYNLITTVGDALGKLKAIKERLDPYDKDVDLTDLSPEATKFILKNLLEIRKGLF